MKNGFIYMLFNMIVEVMNKLNLVELFKFIAGYLTTQKSNQEELIKNKNIAIDIFMVLKWTLIAILWAGGYNNAFCIFIVFYLIVMNVHTYFYYHIWSENAIKDIGNSVERLRRRFISLILAILFSNFTYAYLYHRIFNGDFVWPENINKGIIALKFSFFNSLAGSYSEMCPNSNIGFVIATSQLCLTFIFVAIILSQSIPKITVDESKKEA